MNISRRQFLKLGALTAGMAAASNVLPSLSVDAKADGYAAASSVPGLRVPNGMEGKPAEKLVLGHFITMDEIRPVAEAMTVVDGKIQYIGSKATALTLCDDETIVMDYGDSFIYPGFLEAHCHPISAGKAMVGSANLRDGKNMKEYVELMRRYIEENPDMECYEGNGFIARDEQPTAAMLDEICSDKPVVITSEDGHSVWVNTFALKKFKVTPERAIEAGTDCVRVDKDGNPTGYISENEALRIRSSVVHPKEDLIKQMLAWQEFALSQGYTAVSDAALIPGLVDIYRELAKMDEWKLRTYGWYYVDEKEATVEEMVKGAASAAKKLNSEYAKVVGVKLFMDGVIEAHTGWLIDSYSDQPDYHGVARHTDVETLKKAVVLTEKEGMNIHVHSIGDAASMTIMDAIEQGQKETGNYDQRNAIAHLEVIRPEDVTRIADNHVVAVVAPLWVPRLFGGYAENELLYLGEEREANVYPIQSFRNQGAVIAFHTDYPVTPLMDIPGTIFNAVTRYSYERGKETVRGEEEAIARRDALLGLTSNVAYMWHEEERLGTLEVGKIANMSIYDTDFVNAELDKVACAKLVATVIDGEEVYSADAE